MSQDEDESSNAFEILDVSNKAKKVTFFGVPEDANPSPCPSELHQPTVPKQQDLHKVIQKVHRRALRRRYRHTKRMRSPPPSTEVLKSLLQREEEGETSEASTEAKDISGLHARMTRLQSQMNYMENEIQNAARMELALSNQSKSLREQRQKMTRYYERVSTKLSMVHMQGQEGKPTTAVDATRTRLENNAAASVPSCRPPSSLPPLFNISTTQQLPRRVSATQAETVACAVLIDLSGGRSEA